MPVNISDMRKYKDLTENELRMLVVMLETENMMLRGERDRIINERNTMFKKVTDVDLPASRMSGAPAPVPRPVQQPREPVLPPLPQQRPLAPRPVQPQQ